MGLSTARKLVAAAVPVGSPPYDSEAPGSIRVPARQRTILKPTSASARSSPRVASIDTMNSPGPIDVSGSSTIASLDQAAAGIQPGQRSAGAAE